MSDISERIVKKTTTLLPLISLSLIASSAFAADNTLNVYTYSSFASEWGPGPVIKKAFEAQCNGCKVNFVSLEDGVSILNRVRLEGKNSKADILLGLDNNLMTEAENTGLLTTSNVDTSKLALPKGWSDDTFVPYDYGYFAFVYDSSKLPNPPASLDALIKDQNISVIYQDPRTSTPGQGLMLWIKSVYGDKAPEMWQQLAKHTVTVTKGWSEAYNMFLKGESDMVLSYTTSPAYHIIAENKHQYKAADFKEGHYMQVEVAAKMKNSPHPKLADEFMQFIVSDAFQSQIATHNWMYPVTKQSLPKGFDELTVPSKALEFSADEVATHRKAWIREWQQALTQ
ncbi:thiamine ABC transporter substrate binding subunit [Photobacterium leiognathi]|uniref:thiamine ABC transporter substrate binding subunit n=1 Tax=Photobacterium leiognathi TaxID=553611 RepID=UPI002980F57F|nr:thiamine ABC transporter substrate binding subunit [Photobacterium leiognathi]